MPAAVSATPVKAAQEHKQFAGNILTTDAAAGVVEAIVAVFGNVDEGDDRITPGAFAKTISERGLKARVLDQHNAGSIMAVLGKPLELREVRREELPPATLAAYPEATGGLYAKTQFLLDTEEGNGAFARLRSGAVTEWSIGYDPVDTHITQEMRDGKMVRVRNLDTVRLWEYSPVVWGMNSATSTVSAKGAVPAAGSPAGAASPSSHGKEFVYYEPSALPDRGGYPVQRLGDVLLSNVHEEASEKLDGFLKQGYLSLEEWRAIRTGLDEALTVIERGMPAEVAGRQVYCPDEEGGGSSMGMMGRALEAATKAGRVLSSSNATAIVDAVAALRAVLERAGLMIADGEAEKAAPSALPAMKQAVPATATEEEDAAEADARLLELIDLESQSLAMVSV